MKTVFFFRLCILSFFCCKNDKLESKIYSKTCISNHISYYLSLAAAAINFLPGNHIFIFEVIIFFHDATSGILVFFKQLAAFYIFNFTTILLSLVFLFLLFIIVSLPKARPFFRKKISNKYS